MALSGIEPAKISPSDSQRFSSPSVVSPTGRPNLLARQGEIEVCPRGFFYVCGCDRLGSLSPPFSFFSLSQAPSISGYLALVRIGRALRPPFRRRHGPRLRQTPTKGFVADVLALGGRRSSTPGRLRPRRRLAGKDSAFVAPILGLAPRALTSSFSSSSSFSCSSSSSSSSSSFASRAGGSWGRRGGGGGRAGGRRMGRARGMEAPAGLAEEGRQGRGRGKGGGAARTLSPSPPSPPAQPPAKASPRRVSAANLPSCVYRRAF